METEIGNAAGTIWRILADKGPMPPAQLKREAGLTDQFVLMAVGWLAREDKVDITKDRRGLRVGLRQPQAA